MEPVTSSHIYSRSTLVEVLDDLCVKFILNLPEEELQSIERLSFQIEAAQWYFEDFIREINPSLPTLNLRSFLSKIFAVCPLPLIAGLPPNGAESAFLHFMAYKTRVPVRGAIILNPTMDKCLLVKGWKKGASWSFPRGKINKDEDDLVCAIREVREETGFDCEGFARKGDFVEMTMRDQNLKLFIVPGIPEDTAFECQTRKEISDIKWHKLSDLPTYNKQKKQQNPPQNDIRTGKYYMVLPFLKDLRKWISTTGRQWLQDQHQQKLSAAANLIPAEETEFEEELTSPPPIHASIGSGNFQNTQPANGYSNNIDHDEASMRLKNMLHLGPSPKEQVDQSSVRLMNMLSGGVSIHSGNNEHLDVAQLGPNPRTLLSMLRGGDASSALSQPPEVNRQATPQTPKRAPPAPNQPFSIPQPQQQAPNPPTQIPQSAENPQPMQQQKKAPTPLRNTGGIGAGTGWPQFPRNVPEELPSPPPTSSFTPSPQMQSSHPQPSQYNHPAPPAPTQSHPAYPPPPPQQPAFSPVNQNGYVPPQRYPQQASQPPPTPLDAFIPPPVPSKPPDPGQAGMLLSILKGATPVSQQANIYAPPPALQTPSPTQTKTTTPTPNPQKPPTPKGPRAQQQNQGNKIHPRGNANGAPAAALSSLFTPFPPQPFNPPSRPSTTQPQFRPSSSAPGGQSQYGPPKAKTPVQPAQGLAFDRRESVSNEQQQTLLAMFRTGTPGPATTQLNEEAVMSSPEQSPIRPMRVRSVSGGSRGGSRSGSRRGGKRVEIPRSPLGKDREDLMAYLEGVATGGGH